MLVRDLVHAVKQLAPKAFAESWDKVGLLVGRTDAPLKGPVLLTIDLTERVLDEAQRMGVSAVISYHPPIWEPLARLTDESARQRIILRCAELGIAVYSPHTALDAAPGGVTDWLCEGLSGGNGKIAGDCRALTPHAKNDVTQEVKIVTFVPRDDAEKVRNALASAGAGRIGGYQVCSFSTEGMGTFLGDANTKPTLGTPGRLEHVEELRLEMVCSKAALPIAMETLRSFHPYEEPPIDVYELMPRPERTIGAGRRLVLDQPVSLPELGDRLRNFLKTDSVSIADVAPAGSTSTVHTIGVVPGAGASMLSLAKREGCDVFITGEMKHHDVLEALHQGMSVILGGHTPTERGYLPRFSQRLGALMPDVKFVVSAADKDPLVLRKA